MNKRKIMLIMGVTARKQSESECFLQICKIWLNYVGCIKNSRILGCHISKREIVSMKLQSCYNKMSKTKMILIMG